MKKSIILYLFLTILTVISAACSQTTSKENDAKSSDSDTITVSTITYPLQDFTEKMGGEYVQVNSIVPSEVEAHSFDPTTKTVIKLAKSDAFIYTGTGIEGFTEKVIKVVKNEKVAVVKASEGVELINSGFPAEIEAGDEKHTGEEKMEHQNVDPHVWLDHQKVFNLLKI